MHALQGTLHAVGAYLLPETLSSVGQSLPLAELPQHAAVPAAEPRDPGSR